MGLDHDDISSGPLHQFVDLGAHLSSRPATCMSRASGSGPPSVTADQEGAEAALVVRGDRNLS